MKGASPSQAVYVKENDKTVKASAANRLLLCHAAAFSWDYYGQPQISLILKQNRNFFYLYGKI